MDGAEQGGRVATRDVFTDEELDQLRRFPDISREELIRYFTLTPADEAFVVARHGAANRLGAAVQLCSLPWLGFVPDDVVSAPPVAVARLSERLRIPVGELVDYGSREQTRTDHLREVARYLGWRLAEEFQWRELDEFLFARAMEHDPPKLLFRLGCEYLASSRVIRPGVVTVLMRVAAAREKSRAETWQRVAHLVEPTRAAELDRLLVVDPLVGFTRLHWLGRGATQPSPAAVTVELEKLRYLRGLDAHELDLSMLPAERRRFLAALGRRLSAQQLVRRDPQRRYPILLTLLAQSAVDVLDEVLALFDQSISARESHAKQKMIEALAERAKAGGDRQALLDDLLVVLIDVGVPDEQVGSLLRGLGMDRLRAAVAAKTARLPRDHGHLSSLDASLSYLRRFAPEVLAAVRFDGGAEVRSLLDGVTVLSGLYATGGRKVPDGAPTDFVPHRRRGYLEAAAAAGDVTAYRRYWELCVLLGLRDGLRCGDVFVPGSRRYADPASFLLTPAQWEPQRSEFCRLVGKPPAAADALAAAEDELNAALTELDPLLGAAGGVGAVRLTENGELVIPRLTAETVPAEADELRDQLAALLPRISVAALLVEVDARTGFLDSLSHAGGKVTRSGELKRNLIYVLIAEATNMGLTAMAEACGVPYDVLAWTNEWHLREETLRTANTTIVNHHHGLPLSQVFGPGALSSSDGQRFPTKGKSITARAMSRYFARGQGISTYTHVSDQHSTYGTKVIAATAPESHYVLDEILGNATDLPIAEHATDTHGASLANFALFDLVGKQLSPRIRDLGGITLYRTGPRADFTARYPRAGPLLTRRLNTELITTHWDDLLRIAASVKFGHATAALVVGKLCSSKRQQNALSAAIKEYGALRRTIHAAQFLSDETYRRKIARQLNKGENLHALRRDLFYASEGAIRHRNPEQQTEQAWCLTIATNAIVTWISEYYGRAIAEMRAGGHLIQDEVLAHLWPTHHDNVNFFGTITVDIDGELAKLDTDGYRPLRHIPATASTVN